MKGTLSSTATILMSMFLWSNFGWSQQQNQSESLKEAIQSEKPTVETVAGASVYKFPLIFKVNPRKLKLFPHYKPARAALGWTHAFLEPTTPTACPVIVEEIPPHTTKLVGRMDTGYYIFFGLSGKGYTEFRQDPSKPGTSVVWQNKDYFYKPYGQWYGHANPFDEPARIMTFICHLGKDDWLNPYISRTRTVQEQIFPGERREPPPADITVSNVDWPTVLKKAASPGSADMDIVTRGAAKIPVFQGRNGGAPFNMGRMEWPLFYKKIRGQEGWRGGHVEPGPEMGYRAYFDVLEEIAPHSSEIGHKHGAGFWFIAVKGKGYIALRATVDSPETRIDWEDGDMWVMPWMTAAGTWHSHANPYEEPARFITSGQPIWDNDGLLDGTIPRVFHDSGDGVDDKNPDYIFRKKDEVTPGKK